MIPFLKGVIMLNNGKQWPIGITIATIFIICSCAFTIYIALLQPVQEDKDMMIDYHTYDNTVNDIIKIGILFDKKYKVSFVGDGVSLTGSTFGYKIVDFNNKPIKNAIIDVIITRPITIDQKIILDSPIFINDIYSFQNIQVPNEGRWNILTKISIGNLYKHINLKSDTSDSNVYEYGLNNPMRDQKANN